MLRRRERLFFAIMLAADVTTLLAGFVLAYWVRSRLLSFRYGSIPAFWDYAWVMWIVVPSFVLALANGGLYQSARYRSPGMVVGSVAKAMLLGTLTVLAVLYMMKQDDLSRLVLNIFTLLCVALLSTEKLAVKVILDRAANNRRKRGNWQALIVGERDEAQVYLRLLEAHPHWGVVTAGIVSPTQPVTLAAVSAVGGRAERSVTAPVDWRELLNDYLVDEVVAVSPWSKASSFSTLQEACAERGLIFRMLVMMPPCRGGRYNVDDIGAGNYLVSLEMVPQDFLPMMVKRAMDIAGSLVGLVLCGLVYLWYAPRLWRESPGPTFFSQKRVGRNGRLFECYKFRTMFPNAEPPLRKHNHMRGPIFKLRNDPRVTPSGRFMRSTHLDELPQFWNTLRGEMSVVGTRPPTPDEVMAYESHHHRRLSMKPGITGLWQVNGNGAVPDFEEVVKLDCAYIDNWSLWLDCKIIVKTVFKMARGDGW